MEADGVGAYARELAGRYGFEYEFHPYWPGQQMVQVLTLKLRTMDEIISDQFAWVLSEFSGCSDDQIQRDIHRRFAHVASTLWRTAAQGPDKVKIVPVG